MRERLGSYFVDKEAREGKWTAQSHSVGTWQDEPVVSSLQLKSWASSIIQQLTENI